MAFTSKGGQPVKGADHDINNFNKNKGNKLSAKALRAAKLEMERQAAERELRRQELEKLTKQVDMANRKLGLEIPITPPPKSNEPAEPVDDDIDFSTLSKEDLKSAYKMLNDMRWVYKQVNGRKKLLELVRSDDRQFVAMVIQLMKLEAQTLQTRIKAKEDLGGGQQTVFVVMKGLIDDPELTKRMNGAKDLDIDVRQITHVLDPEAPPYKAEDEKEEKKEVAEGPESW